MGWGPSPLQSPGVSETSLSAVGIGKALFAHSSPLDPGLSFSRAGLLAIDAPSGQDFSSGRTGSVGEAVKDDEGEGLRRHPRWGTEHSGSIAAERKGLSGPPGNRRRGPLVPEVGLGSGRWSLYYSAQHFCALSTGHQKRMLQLVTGPRTWSRPDWGL